MHQTYLPLFHTNALAYSMLASLWVALLRDPAAVFGEPVLGCGAGTQLHLDLDDPVLHEGAAGTRIPKNHKFRLWGTAVSEPPPFAAFGVKTIGWWGMTETITHGIVGEVDQPNTPMSIGAPRRNIRSASSRTTARRRMSAAPAIS